MASLLVDRGSQNHLCGSEAAQLWLITQYTQYNNRFCHIWPKYRCASQMIFHVADPFEFASDEP